MFTLANDNINILFPLLFKVPPLRVFTIIILKRHSFTSHFLGGTPNYSSDPQTPPPPHHPPQTTRFCECSLKKAKKACLFCLGNNAMIKSILEYRFSVWDTMNYNLILGSSEFKSVCARLIWTQTFMPAQLTSLTSWAGSPLIISYN